jgi:hypothetical protein
VLHLFIKIQVHHVYVFITKELPPWSTVLLEKLTVSQLVKKFPTFMEHESSLPYSQEPATGPYPEPDESNPYLTTIFLYVGIIFLSFYVRVDELTL